MDGGVEGRWWDSVYTCVTDHQKTSSVHSSSLMLRQTLVVCHLVPHAMSMRMLSQDIYVSNFIGNHQSMNTMACILLCQSLLPPHLALCKVRDIASTASVPCSNRKDVAWGKSHCAITIIRFRRIYLYTLQSVHFPPPW